MRKSLTVLLVIICVLQSLLGIAWVCGSLVTQRRPEWRPAELTEVLDKIRNENEALDRDAVANIIEEDQKFIDSLESNVMDALRDMFYVGIFLLVLPVLLLVAHFTRRSRGSTPSVTAD